MEIEKVGNGGESCHKATRLCQDFAMPFNAWKTLSTQQQMDGEGWASTFISCAHDTMGL